MSLAAAVSVAAPKPPAAAAGAQAGRDAKTPAADAPKPETRVAAIGDSDFASNGWLGVQGNRDLFLNTVGWLSQQENLISIRPRDPEDRRLTMSAQAQRNVKWLALLVIPVAIFAPRDLRLDEETRMRGGRSLLVLFVAFGGLLAYLYFVDAKKPVAEEGAEKHDKVFTVDADKVEGVEGEELLRRDLRRSRRARTAGSSWSPSRPRSTRARSPASPAISPRRRSRASSTRRRRTCSRTGSTSRGSRWRSRRPATRTTGACSWAARRRPGGDLYAQRGGDKKVFLIPSYVETSFDRKPFDLRDKKILTFDREKVDRLEIAHGDVKVELVKAGQDWNITAPVQAQGGFQRRRIDRHAAAIGADEVAPGGAGHRI